MDLFEQFWLDFLAAQLEEKLELSIGGTGTGIDYLESPVSDGTIEENFEEALVDAPVVETGEQPFFLYSWYLLNVRKALGYIHCVDGSLISKNRFNCLILTADDQAALDEELEDEEDYLDISRLGIVEVVGDDSAGRKVIVVSACKLPPVGKDVFNHAKLLRFPRVLHTQRIIQI